MIYSILAIPFIFAACCWKHRRTFTIPTLSILQPFVKKRHLTRRTFVLALLLLSSECALFVAISGNFPPIKHTSLAQFPAILFAVDISGSMEAVDLQDNAPTTTCIQMPSRLAIAKQCVAKLIMTNPKLCQFALIAFSQDAVCVSPLTTNHTTLLNRLQDLTTELLPDGTAIGKALSLASSCLECNNHSQFKAVILISDGVDHSQDEESLKNAIHRLKVSGIPVFCIGIGSKNAFHPVIRQNKVSWEPIGERLDMNQLNDIAYNTNGTATCASSIQEINTVIQQAIPEPQRPAEAPSFISVPAALLIIAGILAITGKSSWYNAKTVSVTP